MFACSHSLAVSHASTLAPVLALGAGRGEADLGPVGEVSRLLVVQLDSLGVQVYGGWPVVRRKGLVALILERYGSLLWGRHGRRRGVSSR